MTTKPEKHMDPPGWVRVRPKLTKKRVGSRTVTLVESEPMPPGTHLEMQWLDGRLQFVEVDDPKEE